MPAEWDQAAMLRADLAAARQEWLKAAKQDPAQYVKREQSDFLVEVNHGGQVLDFHSLRHTCGAWLAMTGAHPKAIQTVMRHSAITLTMDTYGHLCPGQEAATVARLPDMRACPPQASGATGTCDETVGGGPARAVNAQCAEGGNRRGLAGIDLIQQENPRDTDERKVLPLSVLDKSRRESARIGESRPGRIRTCDQGIMSPLL